MKSATNLREAYLRSIEIDESHFLLPVCAAHQNDKALINQITNWRNLYSDAFPTQFKATPDSTKEWLSGRLLDVSDRILFLVVNKTGETIGHLGFNNCLNQEHEFEIDNVVKGDLKKNPGLFSRALTATIEWARKVIGVEKFYLRVLDDNHRAINFYKKNGFNETHRTPLKKEKKPSLTIYREAVAHENADKHFIRMHYQPTKTIGENLILTAGPSISAKETTYVFDAVLNGWNSNWANYLNKFEQQFASYIGVKYAIATSSCTGALQIALMALKIGPGDEVIVPDETWVATANAVRYVGATPVFADVELDTWNIDANSVELLINSRTKAIIPVHMYGHPARMDKLITLAKKHSLKLIEDAAPAIGATWKGERCGTFGDFAAFSFQGAKLLVTGEGGMLVTNNEELYLAAKKIWDQGRNPSKAFWIDELGVKYKMSNIQAALGLAQLERVEELIEMKRRIFSWYEQELEGMHQIVLNKEIENARSIYWMTSLRLVDEGNISRDELIIRLKQRNIDSRPVFPAISQYPIWHKISSPQKNALKIGETALNLPSGTGLTNAEVKYICSNIRSILTN